MACTRFVLRGFRPDWRLLGLIGLAAFYLLPALEIGYLSEDCAHSVGTVGRLILRPSESLIGVTIDNIRGSVKMGRFFPLTPALISMVFFLIRDLVVYKAYLVAVTVLDVVAFYYLVRRLSGNRDFACFAACLTITLFQFRILVDPLLAYYGQIQLVTACLLFSLLALDLYLNGRGRGWLAASAAAYLLCTLTYEASYTLFLLHLLLIGRARRGWAARLKPLLPFLAVVGLCALTTVVVRRLYPTDLYVHKVSLGPMPFLLAIARQASTALPLSYFLTDPHQIFAHVRGIRSLCGWLAEPGSITVAFGALCLCHACLRRRAVAGNLPAGVGPRLVVMAIMLVVLPVLLIAISPFHQQFLSVGVGWIVVVIECFGVGLLLATPIWKGLGGDRQGRLTRCKYAIVSIAVAILMGLTYRANCEVATCLSAPPGDRPYSRFVAMFGASYQEQRLNLESALDAGLMDDVPGGSTLHVANVYPLWHDSKHGVFFYAKHTGKSYRIRDRSSEVRSSSRAYRIRDVSFGRRSGFVVLSPLGTGNSDSGQEIRLYVRHPGLLSTAMSAGFCVEGDAAAVPRHSTAANNVPPSPELSLIRGGRDWGLFSLRTAVDAIAADSLRPVLDSVEAQRGGGHPFLIRWRAAPGAIAADGIAPGGHSVRR
ncbi:MAG TPA: hypothetical protein VKA15_02205 [Isosphaeraceae bacterium]|nr:hypothetical protein [Isosphaeraceae bacterium]